MDQFLSAMTNAGERRGFDRRAHEAPATLKISGQSVAGRMIDISDGGTSLRIDGTWSVGMPAAVVIHDTELPGRIVEAASGIVRVQFLFDQETHNKVMEFFDRGMAA